MGGLSQPLEMGASEVGWLARSVVMGVGGVTCSRPRFRQLRGPQFLGCCRNPAKRRTSEIQGKEALERPKTPDDVERG